jgi:hypothetical protein
VSADLDLPATAWGAVGRMLEPFVDVTAQTGEQSPWRLVGEISDSEPVSRELVPYGGHADTGVRIGIDPLDRVVRLVATSESRYLPVHTVRAVRTLLRLTAAETDPTSLFLHAGMFARNGRGLAIVGGKRSGKTSTVLAGISAGADFVSNDDLSIQLHADGVVGVGWPRSVSIRTNTLIPLGVSLPEKTAHPANRLFDTYRDEAKLLFPYEIAAVFGIAIAPSAAIVGLVFPSFAPIAEAGLVRLSPADAAVRIRDNVLDPPVKGESLETHFTLPPPAELARRADRLASALPAFELRQSLDSVRGATGLLDGLLV